jgi:hypothetical protein
MVKLEQSHPHSHIRHFFSALWHIFYEDVYEKYFVLPHVNRSRFKAIINERYKTNEKKQN